MLYCSGCGGDIMLTLTPGTIAHNLGQSTLMLWPFSGPCSLSLFKTGADEEGMHAYGLQQHLFTTG